MKKFLILGFTVLLAVLVSVECKSPPACKYGQMKVDSLGCNICACENGEWACTLLRCKPNKCKDGETSRRPLVNIYVTCICHKRSWICPVIDTYYHRSYNSKSDPPECKAGETKPAGDGCNICGCDQGRWVCTPMICNPYNKPLKSANLEEINSRESYLETLD